MCEYCELSQMREELADLRAIGDTMQSAFSRVAQSVHEIIGNDVGLMGYESYMALLEGESAIEKWTEARKKSK